MDKKEFANIIALHPYILAIPIEQIKANIHILRGRSFSNDQLKSIVRFK